MIRVRDLFVSFVDDQMSNIVAIMRKEERDEDIRYKLTKVSLWISFDSKKKMRKMSVSVRECCCFFNLMSDEIGDQTLKKY